MLCAGEVGGCIDICADPRNESADHVTESTGVLRNGPRDCDPYRIKIVEETSSLLAFIVLQSNI